MSRRRAGRASPAAAALATALVLAACSNTGGPIGAQVRAWANGASWAENDGQIESDLTFLANGVRRHYLAGLRTECAGFGDDVQSAYGNLPTPLQSITDELNTAYIDFGEASVSCSQTSSFGSRSFRAYSAHLASGLRAYDEAKRRLAAFGVR